MSAHESTAASACNAGGSTTPTMRFLVVEDEFLSRRLLTTFLRDYGECDVAVDGREALEAFRMANEGGHPYDAIFLDIRLPGVDGQETLRDIREWEIDRGIALGRGVPIIMTTAMSDPSNILGAFKGGCERYLRKPIGRDDLHGALVAVGIVEREPA